MRGGLPLLSYFRPGSYHQLRPEPRSAPLDRLQFCIKAPTTSLHHFRIQSTASTYISPTAISMLLSRNRNAIRGLQQFTYNALSIHNRSDISRKLDLLRPKFFSSSTHNKMPITELVYTLFKPGSPSEATVPKALEHLAGVNGLLLLKHGKVLQVDGADVPAEKSSILTLGKSTC